MLSVSTRIFTSLFSLHSIRLNCDCATHLSQELSCECCTMLFLLIVESNVVDIMFKFGFMAITKLLPVLHYFLEAKPVVILGRSAWSDLMPTTGTLDALGMECITQQCIYKYIQFVF